jgi:DNA-binding HxlR family transcriptional regulator
MQIMSARRYGQFCGVTRALEIVGERWALLIIRDLLVSPKRFTDLRQGLPRIPTNILSTRLKELEEAGVVRRRVLPRPSGAVVYELTEYGQELDEVVMGLGRWGAQRLGEPGPDDIVTEDSMIMAMRSTFHPEAAIGRNVRYQLNLGPIVIHMDIDNGHLEVAGGEGQDRDIVIEAGPAIKALMAGEITPDEALADGSVKVTGDPDLLKQFAETFYI